MDWLNAATQGILLGGLYALFATGLSLVFGTMRLVNLAHGDLTILPAYVALMIVGALNFNPFYSIPITMVIMFIVGYLLQRGLLNLTLGKGDVSGVIVTFGLSIVIQNALLLAFTANSQGLDAGTVENLSIKINDRLAVGWLPLIIFLMSIVVITALQLFMSRTKMGRAFRRHGYRQPDGHQYQAYLGGVHGRGPPDRRHRRHHDGHPHHVRSFAR
jgi:branched-chain amino acid transport system permease protein